MASDDLSDDYVAKLLKEDAKKASQNYALGLGFLPKRATNSAPKPNMRFLHNILKETTSHNQALLAKEAEESRARLRALQRPKESHVSRHGHHERSRDDREEPHRAKRKRVDIIDSDRNRLSPPRESKRHRSERDSSAERDYDRYKKRRTHEDNDEEYERKSHHSRRQHRRGKNHSDEEDEEVYEKSRERRSHHKSRRNRSRSHSIGDTEEEGRKRIRHSDKHGRSRRHKNRSRSPSKDEARQKERSHRKRQQESSRTRSRTQSPASNERRTNSRPQQRLSTSPRSLPWKVSPRSKASRPSAPVVSSDNKEAIEAASDSDPLEDIVGPLPPAGQSKVKVRGRGNFSASAMDSRFDSSYDPSADVELDLEETDDWELALEAMRDRARFKQQHGDRLRQAGFSEEAVKKWEKGGEKTEDDVKWSKKGEGREWDRGKVVDADGDIGFKADWGRLKETDENWGRLKGT